MTKITLTRFNVSPRSYSYQDCYRACFDPNAGENCPGILGYMDGLIQLMGKFTAEPAAWSFGEWKGSKAANNHAEFWLSASAIGLEYRGKDLSAKAAALHEKAEALGYAHIIFDSMTRKGEDTVTIVFPLTEAINEGQYARLAKVLMSELDEYLAADGNCAMTHLFHVHERTAVQRFDGAVIAPKAKIKETAKLYQSMDPNQYCAGGKRAVPHLVEPTYTSHDGLFEWAPSEAEKAQRTADELLASIGVKLS
ncbi:hypothetical protein [Sphingobium sp. PAMC28499]|uniref:hypothetical protein n=1 Tax=Sphingobium sp. PAMC28499 TaxID=2565554 RepID=UPI001447D89A|nr:hypothetical protein [Sphingobium sp. PAMC28499]